MACCRTWISRHRHTADCPERRGGREPAQTGYIRMSFGTTTGPNGRGESISRIDAYSEGGKSIFEDLTVVRNVVDQHGKPIKD
jgi:hypothetical protein